MAGEQDASLSPDEVFALLGNEVRAEILYVLSNARQGDGDLQALAFSELRSRIEPDIVSSQFNYHLQQLVGHFVERSGEGTAQLDKRMAADADEGYVLRPEGTMLTRKLRASASTSDATVTPFTLDLDCYFCDTPVEATYGNALFKAQCPDCEYIYEYELTPPGAISDDEQATVRQISRYLRGRRLQFARGGCPLCANGLETDVLPPEEITYPRSDRREVMINRWCDNCGERDYLKIGEVLLREADLISFCEANGCDVTTTPLWQLEFVVTDRAVTVRSNDPWEIAFQLTMEGDTLELVLDEELTVVERSLP